MGIEVETALCRTWFPTFADLSEVEGLILASLLRDLRRAGDELRNEKIFPNVLSANQEAYCRSLFFFIKRLSHHSLPFTKDARQALGVISLGQVNQKSGWAASAPNLEHDIAAIFAAVPPLQNAEANRDDSVTPQLAGSSTSATTTKTFIAHNFVDLTEELSSESSQEDQKPYASKVEVRIHPFFRSTSSYKQNASESTVEKGNRNDDIPIDHEEGNPVMEQMDPALARVVEHDRARADSLYPLAHTTGLTTPARRFDDRTKNPILPDRPISARKSKTLRHDVAPKKRRRRERDILSAGSDVNILEAAPNVETRADLRRSGRTSTFQEEHHKLATAGPGPSTYAKRNKDFYDFVKEICSSDEE